MKVLLQCDWCVGHGKLSMGDGSYYEGEFDGGEINGHGLRYFATTGNFYSGEFCAGELHGQGVMRYADGSTHEGTWSNNKREGKLFVQHLLLWQFSLTVTCRAWSTYGSYS